MGIGAAGETVVSYLLVSVVGLVAGVISGTVGTGSSIMLLPVLVFAFGPKEAVPIMAVASVMVNLAKMASWWRELDWRAFAVYSCTGIPAAALGARTLIILPARFIDVALGAFFLLMIPVRYWLRRRSIRLRLWHLGAAGAAIGFLTGIVASTGPLSVPAFTAYGLVKGAFLSTEAASSLAVFISKVIVFRSFGALPAAIAAKGLIVGLSLMIGSFAAKAIVVRLSPRAFQRLLDALMFCSGVSMLIAAAR